MFDCVMWLAREDIVAYESCSFGAVSGLVELGSHFVSV
jgi:hypothetical protein